MHVAALDVHEGEAPPLHGFSIVDLRARAKRVSEQLVRRADWRRSDLSRGGTVLCIQPAMHRPGRLSATILEETPGVLTQEVNGSGQWSQRVIVVFPASNYENGAEATRSAANRLADRLERHGCVGVSSVHRDPDQFPCAIHEAELMVEVLSNSEDLCLKYVNSATYRMLFRILAADPGEFLAIYEETVAPLVRYDEQHRTELVKTLAAYLDQNCNMNATGTTVFAHRHTIAYRLNRVSQLSALDPFQFADREQLGLGLKAHAMVKAITNGGSGTNGSGGRLRSQ
jgi:sugar diacid utilization regulator